MPYVPTGCLVHLEKQAKETVLNNIKAAASNLRGENLLSELRQLQTKINGNVGLQDILDYLNLDTPDKIYERGLPYELLEKSRGEASIAEASEKYNLNKGFQRLLLIDDANLLSNAKLLITTGSRKDIRTAALLQSILWGKKKPDDESLEAIQSYLFQRPALIRDLKELIDWILENKVTVPQNTLPDLTDSLNLHASYTREQIILSVGLGSFEKPRTSREGVLHVEDRKLDVFFADINKSEDDFSPTTMYEDYAITDRLFHWQSQSNTQ